MKINHIPLVFIVASLTLSCSSNISSVNNTQTYSNLSNRYSISGAVSFPSKNSFATKATLDEVSQNATVSLIYPNNHATFPNKTIATGLTDSSSNFSINVNQNFTPNLNEIFILEAIKRLPTENALLSVRTFVKWNGKSWDSITNNKITINSTTTTICAMTSLIPTLVSPSDSIKSISIVEGNISANDIKNADKVIIKANSILSTTKTVEHILLNNYDPTQYLAYKNGFWTFNNPETVKNIVTTIAGNTSLNSQANFFQFKDNVKATNTNLAYPKDIAFDSLGNLYISEYYGYRIRKVDKTTGIISTVAGGGTSRLEKVLATDAHLIAPLDIAFDSNDNLYISNNRDGSNVGWGNIIMKVDKTTGIITTFAGNGFGNFYGDGGLASNAGITATDIAFDRNDNLYIDDANRIRKVDKTTGIISTIAGGGAFSPSLGDGGLATNANLFYSQGINFDSLGNLYIADSNNYRIRKVDKTTGIITTVVGNGIKGSTGDGGLATNAQLYNPTNIEFDSLGNVYITDTGNNKIRKIDKATGIINTVAGNGVAGFNGNMKQAIATQLYSPTDIKFDRNDNLYIADSGNQRIRKIDKTTGIINTVAGNGFSFGDGGLATDASLKNPTSGIFDNLGNLYISDTEHHQIRKIDKDTGTITTVAGNGVVSLYNNSSGYSGDNVQATNTQLNYPRNLAFDSNYNLYISSSGRVRKVDKATGIITTVAGGGTSLGDGGLATNASLGTSGIAFDSLGNLYIAEGTKIRKVDKATGIISTVAGGGTSLGDGELATNAQLKEAINITFDSNDNLYISDYYSGGYSITNINCRIRKVDKATGIISTVAGTGVAGYSGDGGLASLAQLTRPSFIAFDSLGNLYIQDSGAIRKIDKKGIISTIITGYNNFFLDSKDNLYVIELSYTNNNSVSYYSYTVKKIDIIPNVKF